MTFKTIKYYIFFIAVFFSVANFAHANLEITEINNPEVKANHCWIKVYNNDSIEINLTEWFVMDDDGIVSPQPWHYHKINADDPAKLTLAPNSYAIITDSSASTISTFKSKNPNIFGPLFYGSLTFGKEGGTMGLSKDKKNIISQKSYGVTETPSSNNDENTSGDSTSNIDNTNTSSNSSSSTSSNSIKKEIPIILKTTTKIISPKVVVSGIPFTLNSLTTTNNGEIYNIGVFVWSFGDGMTSKLGESSPFTYLYNYPGEYVLTLSYLDSLFSKVADATDRIIIKVIPSDVYISGIGNDTDPYIEIGNKSTYEIVLSNWIVTAGTHYFIIPEGTTLLPGKKIKLSPKITGFVGADLYSIIISNPSKEMVANYPVQVKKLTQNKVFPKVSSDAAYSNFVQSNNSKDEPLQKDSKIINLNDLESSAGNSRINISSSVYPLIGLLLVIGIGITSFLLIKRKRDVEDYVEKGISARDMTIIE